MRRDILLLAVLGMATVAGMGGAGSATAQGMDEGIINAVVYRQLPQGVPLAVKPLDNSQDNMALKSEFEKALRAVGYTVADDASLVLSFDTRDESGAYSSSGERTLLEFSANGGSGSDEEARFRVNIFDSQRGGVFNSGQGDTNIVTRSRYRIDATLDDSANGQRLWQSWAVGDLGGRTTQSATSAMVPTMVSRLGQTVKREVFSLP